MRYFTILLFVSFFTYSFSQTTTFRDDFSNNNNNWPNKNWKTSSANISDGCYNLNITDSKTYNFCKNEVHINPAKDFSIEVKAMQTSGDNQNGYGFAWGYYREEDYNIFQITSDGYFYISSTIDKKTKTIQKWTKLKDTTVIKPLNQWNIIKFVQSGNKSKFYVNNSLVFETDKLPCTGIDQGLFTRSIKKVKFDYIEIKHIDSEVKTVNNPSKYKLENLGENINSKNEEKSVKISADGQTMFFTKNAPSNKFDAEKSEIYRSDLQQDGSWGKAINLGGPINNASHNFPVNISPDKNEIYVGNVFSSTGEFIETGLSKSIFKNGKWESPKKVNLKGLVNNKNQTSYCVAPDGKHILSSLSNEESIGGHDLFVSFINSDGSWSKPKNMGSIINSFAGDFTPYMAGDNKTIFFSSYGHKGYGNADIFMAKRLDDTWLNWSEPLNVGPSINSEAWDAFYCVSAVGDYAYLTAYNKSEGFGSGDIYRVKLPEDLRPEPVTIISGQVIDAETKQAIDAKVVYEDLATGKEIGVAVSSKENGFQISLPTGKNYGFLAISDNYISVSSNLDLTKLNKFATKKINLEVAPIKKGQVVRINNLFFDLAKYSLRNESKSELNRLVSLLKTNKEINIEVIGHTDSQGNKDSNKKLSENRAKSVLNYLVQNGISSDRITSSGRGADVPLESNDTEKGRQINRRVEFKIK